MKLRRMDINIGLGKLILKILKSTGMDGSRDYPKFSSISIFPKYSSQLKRSEWTKSSLLPKCRESLKLWLSIMLDTLYRKMTIRRQQDNFITC